MREHRRRRRELFVPLTHPPGHAQADFGEARVVIGGVEQKAHFFAFHLPHSDACYVRMESRVVCCVLAAFPEAEQAVRREYPEIRVVAGRELPSELKAFHPGAEIFESAEEVAYAKRVINAIGQEITPSMPLGYEGMERLMALGSRCPNNSLPVFWSDGTNRRPWIPLFARP